MEYTIITGATSGIGYELASIYAKNGHNLILIARRLDILNNLKNDLRALYRVSIECYVCDLNDLNNVSEVFKLINNNYQIKCLINNAGVGIFESINQISIENINYQNNINFTAPTYIISLLIDNINQNKGSIINVCSILSYIPNNLKSVYVANKHALLGFTNSIRIEYIDLHVLSVHPATVKTAFFKDDNYFKNKKALSPNLVATKIFKAHKNKKRKLDVPRTIFLINILYLFFPRLVDKLNNKYFSK